MPDDQSPRPLISIITAAFNSEKTIGQALASIERQEFANYEHIVVDGASTDGTLEVVKSFGFSRLLVGPDDGIYDALNKGIRAAKGEIVGFLHSDDVFSNEKVLSTIAQTFKPDVEACYGDLIYVNGGRTVRNWIAGSYRRSKLAWGWMPPHPTYYMRRTFYEKFGLYDKSFKISADYEAMLRYLWEQGVKPVYIPKVLVEMATGGASNRNLANILLKTKEDISALKTAGISWPPAIIGKNFGKLPQFFIR